MARRLMDLSDMAFAAYAEKTMPISQAEMEVLLVNLCRFQVEAADLARELAPARSLDAAQYEQACALAALDTLRQAVLLRDREIARATLRATAQRLGIDLDDTGEDYQRLAMRALQALIESGEENLRRDSGQFALPATGRYLSGTLQVPPAIQDPARTSTSRSMPGEDVSKGLNTVGMPEMRPAATSDRPQPPASPSSGEPEEAVIDALPEDLDVDENRLSHRTKSGSKGRKRVPSKRSIRAVGEEYVTLRCRGHANFRRTEVPDAKTGKSWEKNSAPNVRATINLLESGLGSGDLEDLSDRALTEFWSVVVRLPRSYGDKTDDRRSLREIAEEADLQGARNESMIRHRQPEFGQSPGKTEFDIHMSRIPRLRVATVYRHMQDAQRIVKFAETMGYVRTNLMRDHIWDSRELARRSMMQEDNKRETWSQKLPVLLRSKVFQEKLEDPGAPMFWAPLIALHAGLRSEEILQLGTNDVKDVEGIPCFVLRQGLGQSLKSAAARRTVPVHRNLIALGFLQLVALRKRQSEPRLFPWLQRSKAKATFTETFSKEFTRYRKEVKVYQAGLDFHAFRTTFNQALISTECLDSQRRYMLGHVESDTGIKHYTPEGFPIAKLRDRVDAVIVDVSMVRKPFDRSVEAGVSDLNAHRQARAMTAT